MISFGRRNKVLLLAVAIVCTLLFVAVKPGHYDAAHDAVSNVEHVVPESGLGGGLSTPEEDDSLLSAAQIDQNKLAPEEKVYHAVDKADVSSGTDATLKNKEDAINKAQDAEKAKKPLSKDKHKGAASAEDDADDGVSAPPKKSKAKAAAKADKAGSAKEGAKADSKADSKAVAASKGGAEDAYEYVVMIDAGSTGSRVHVYTFDTSVSPPKLIKEDFEMLKPGLSSFDTDTEGAAASLDPLLNLALKSIPKSKHSCSPVAVKATAGLRLLGTTKSNAILKQVKLHLEEDYPFPVVQGDGVSIMEGSDEGVFAWITANYLLGNIGSSKRTDTAAVFDLGGGSTQIVFEPNGEEEMIEGEHKYDIEFGGRKFNLYQYSHLGYGLMQGRRRVNAQLVAAELKTNKNLVPLTATEEKQKNLKAEVSIENPCVPVGVIANDVVVELDDKSKYVVNFVSTAKDKSDAAAQSAAQECKFITESILNKEEICKEKPCSFNGVYQPSFKQSFSPEADMFVFSYFYDRLEPIGMPLTFTLQDMKDITQQVCAGSHKWDEYFTQPKHIKELEEEPLWCQDLTFMTSLLHVGYDIPLTRELRTAKTIAGNELGWCLGASLPLLEKNSGWTCKVTKEF